MTQNSSKVTSALLKNLLGYSALAGVVLGASVPSFAQAEGEDSKLTNAFLDEITVTARKREENLQDTPISITAFSSAGLESPRYFGYFRDW